MCARILPLGAYTVGATVHAEHWLPGKDVSWLHSAEVVQKPWPQEQFTVKLLQSCRELPAKKAVDVNAAFKELGANDVIDVANFPSPSALPPKEKPQRSSKRKRTEEKAH